MTPPEIIARSRELFETYRLRCLNESIAAVHAGDRAEAQRLADWALFYRHRLDDLNAARDDREAVAVIGRTQHALAQFNASRRQGERR
jgi:hypothetical protein